MVDNTSLHINIFISKKKRKIDKINSNLLAISLLFLYSKINQEIFEDKDKQKILKRVDKKKEL